MIEHKSDSPIQKSFTRLYKGDKQKQKGFIAQGYFYNESQMQEDKHLYQLFEDKIYYFSLDTKQSEVKCIIDNDTKFYIIRKKSCSATPTSKSYYSKIGKEIGIKFDRKGRSFEIFSDDPELIIKWKNQLSKKINQRGFQELFTAYAKLGYGNTSKVYLVQCKERKQLFAAKSIPKTKSYENSTMQKQIQNEIELMRQVNHQNVCKLHDVFETDNTLYLILDLLKGGSLLDKFESQQKFNIIQSKQMIKSIIEGVNSMNKVNIMHRDIKPENIMFRDKDDLKCVIGDLGLATKVNLDRYLFSRCGTPGYVAPEVINLINENDKYNPVCDMYSIGIILHILLIKISPFNAFDQKTVLDLNRKAYIDFKHPQYKKIPPQAFDLLKKMLENNPSKRITAEQALLHPFFYEKNQQKENFCNKKNKPLTIKTDRAFHSKIKNSQEYVIKTERNDVSSSGDEKSTEEIKKNENYQSPFSSELRISKFQRKLQQDTSLNFKPQISPRSNDKSDVFDYSFQSPEIHLKDDQKDDIFHQPNKNRLKVIQMELSIPKKNKTFHNNYEDILIKNSQKITNYNIFRQLNQQNFSQSVKQQAGIPR